MRASAALEAINRPVSQFLIFLIRIYQISLSRVLPPRCRFAPSCSHYAAEAIQRHGPVRGLWLAIVRVGKCHPLHEGGIDPVP